MCWCAVQVCPVLCHLHVFVGGVNARKCTTNLLPVLQLLEPENTPFTPKAILVSEMLLTLSHMKADNFVFRMASHYLAD